MLVLLETLLDLTVLVPADFVKSHEKDQEAGVDQEMVSTDRNIFELMEVSLKVPGQQNCRLLAIAQVTTCLLSSNVHMHLQSPDSPESKALTALSEQFAASGLTTEYLRLITAQRMNISDTLLLTSLRLLCWAARGSKEVVKTLMAHDGAL